jgi:hypothetical protein
MEQRWRASPTSVGSVLSVQNGLVKDEQLARRFGWEKTLGPQSTSVLSCCPPAMCALQPTSGLALALPRGRPHVSGLVAALTRAGIRAEASGRSPASNGPSMSSISAGWPVRLSRMETHRIFKILTWPDGRDLTREVAHLPVKLGIPLLDKGAFSAKTLNEGCLPNHTELPTGRSTDGGPGGHSA